MTYPPLIFENVAYPNSRRLGIYDGTGNRVGIVPLGPLAWPDTGEKQYSFGALADVHINHATADEDFRRALSWLNREEAVAFTCIAGDLTGNGTEAQLAQYRSAVDAASPNTPVYAITGNHEFYSTVSRSFLHNYTGHPLYYSFTHGEDVFLMCGCYSAQEDGVFTQESLQWLYDTLEENRNRRCFLFQHVFPVGDSGNACGIYDWDIFTGPKGSVFLALMAHYKNTVLFHGHSHLKFYLQELDPKANYSHAMGFRSVHIPSVSVPRDSVNGVLTEISADSEGYVVDVYDSGIHLRGRDFANGRFLPIASYWIHTPLQSIPAKGFTDSSGIIRTQ